MTVPPTLVADGLFEIAADGARLLGSRCTGCDAIYFPRTLSCRNPACDVKAVQHTQLPAAGTLISYTVQRYRPPALFRIDDWSPYAIGLVDLGGGIEVMGMLHAIPLDDIRIGMALKLVAEPLFTGDDGTPVLTYKFAAQGAS